jgi:cyclophilin family peptidyl-prolyl cis-trans isomerase
MISRTSLRNRCSLLLILVGATALLAAGCGGDDNSSSSKKSSSSSSTKASKSDSTSTGNSEAEVAKRANSYDSPPSLKLDPKQKYVVELDTDKGTIDIDIDQKAGPIAAANFVALVKDGFYDGIKFHRVINDFMIQTGDPTGTGMGGPGYEIKDDKVTGEYSRGTVAMANSGPDTGGSQFFIVQGSAVQLAPDYAIFGHARAKDMGVVDKIATIEVDGEAPVEDIKIKSAKLISGTLPG